MQNDLRQASQKAVSKILTEQIEAGKAEYKRNPWKLFLSAFTAGMEVGFSVLVMAAIYTYFNDGLSKGGMNLALAFAYPLGFLFVVIGRSELFTEHTNIAMHPVLAGEASVLDLLKLWSIILVGNLLGGYLIGSFIALEGAALGIATEETLTHLAMKMINYPWGTILGSSILAGWMMGLLSWLVTASQETVSRMLIVILVTAVIGLCGLHHSIVGSVEVFCGLISCEEVKLVDYFYFQGWTTLGNIIGGAFFVGVFKFSHSSR
ncbi:MAG: formate/nitrite transporter family protein [Bacteroidota bacterium]